MGLTGIHSIWHRRITPGDFCNIERAVGAGPPGGGGALYIDIPESVRVGLFKMLDLESPAPDENQWPNLSIDAKVLGDVGQSGTVAFEHIRAGDPRYRIPRQNRQSPGGARHPAWTAANGFPVAPDDINSTEAAGEIIAGGLRIFIVRSLTGDYYAGFTEGTNMPEHWPLKAGLEPLFHGSDPGGVICPRSLSVYPAVVKRIFDAWQRKPNVLLYGPPGTGKTYVMSLIWEMLQAVQGNTVIMLDPDDKDCPFYAINRDLPLPLPVVQDWLTFHQSHDYENFIIGLRPVASISSGGFTLQPRFGRLLELGVQVFLDDFQDQSAVLFVDEINRGHVSRVFGEFITFMDYAYRDVDDHGNLNPRRLPVPMPSVDSSNKYTEPIALPTGGAVKLPVPWYFPRHIYCLASMNSVDRTVAPLDGALGRRFERIDMFPNLGELERCLGVDLPTAGTKIPSAVEQLTAGECAVMILSRLNFQLATTLGPDFELGHTYMMPVGGADDEDDGFRRLAIIWDQGIMPQLQERFLTRQDELIRILGVDGNVPTDYAFRRRVGFFGQPGGDRPSIEPVSLTELAEQALESVKATFRYMASQL